MDKKLSANKVKKAETIDVLSQKVQKAKAMVVADYRGIKHKQMEELRRNLKKHDAEIVVSKNRLLLRALGDQAEDLKSTLENTTATVFAYADEIAPLKELLKFFKSVGMGKTKGGLLGKQVLSDIDVTKLAILPSRDQLLGSLVRQLNAPIQGLHHALQWNMSTLVWALDGIKNKKTQ